MNRKPSLWLMVIMLMFPQIVETIYSPALGSIADSFGVTDVQASQTLSIYFFSFAVGVVVWGIIADICGRRPAMLTGLLVYGCATFVAMKTDSFTTIMIARAVSAFGIAVGSVVTQTMLRDVFSGKELGKVFSLMGMGISISPVLGMLLGGQLTLAGGYQYVFFSLFFMAMLLLVYNLFNLPETQEVKRPIGLVRLSVSMLRDRHIWNSAILVALFNIALFSYYQLGAFTFKNLGYTTAQFGYTGVLLGIGTMLSSYLNKILLAKNVSQYALRWVAAMLLTIGSFGVLTMQGSIWFLVPMILVVMSFGIAIPNILSASLVDYKQQAGSAGAVLGLMYYSMIGGGLTFAGASQNLGLVLMICSTLTLLVTFACKKSSLQ